MLQASGINNPEARFEIINPNAVPGSSTVADSTTLTLRTNLEPDVAKTQLDKLATALQSDRNQLFERSEIFGSTVAGETRNLAQFLEVLRSKLWELSETVTRQYFTHALASGRAVGKRPYSWL